MARRAAVQGRIWILTALGKDRPGIVARVTKILYELGCNLEDSAMTRLGGEFTVMLAFCAPSSLSHAQLERAFRPLSKDHGLATHLKALPRDETAARSGGRPYLISVYGADQPGIVYRVSDLLAKAKINILDVSTHRSSPTTRKGAAPLYLMLLEVELGAGVSPSRFEQRLRRLAERLGVAVNLRPVDPSVL